MNKDFLQELQTLVDAMEDSLKEAVFQLNEAQIKRHEIISLIKNQNEKQES